MRMCVLVHVLVDEDKSPEDPTHSKKASEPRRPEGEMMTARSPRCSCFVSISFAAIIALAAALQPRGAAAQAQPTAVRQFGLSVFGAVTALDPKFGVTTKEIGYAVGGDITYHLHLVDASFEARYTSATGFSADESTYGVGVKAERAFNRFHPYVDFLVGSGNIKFDHPEIYGSANYTHDNSLVYDFGGGLDYDLIRNFAVKVDVQGERWVIGVERPAFYPYNGSVGILYRIPFRELRRR